MDEEGEEAAASRPNVTIPEDLDSREAMVSCALLPLPQLAFSASLCVPPDALIPWSTRSHFRQPPHVPWSQGLDTCPPRNSSDPLRPRGKLLCFLLPGLS